MLVTQRFCHWSFTNRWQCVSNSCVTRASAFAAAPTVRRAPGFHARKGFIVWATAVSTVAFLLTTDSRNLLCCKLPALAYRSSPSPGRAFFDWTASLSISDLGVAKPSTVEDETLSLPTAIEDKILIVCGADRRGRPLIVARPSLHTASTKGESLQAVDECMGTVRQSLRLLPDGEEKILVLYDLDGASFKNLDMVFTKALLDGLSTEFPDRLEKVLIVNCHWSIRAAWSTIRILLHPESQQKVVFYGADYLKQLGTIVDIEHPYMKRLRAKQSFPMYA